jgi:hypothetical protein
MKDPRKSFNYQSKTSFHYKNDFISYRSLHITLIFTSPSDGLKGHNLKPEFRTIHPAGLLPAIEEDGLGVLGESMSYP